MEIHIFGHVCCLTRVGTMILYFVGCPCFVFSSCITQFLVVNGAASNQSRTSREINKNFRSQNASVTLLQGAISVQGLHVLLLHMGLSFPEASSEILVMHYSTV